MIPFLSNRKQHWIFCAFCRLRNFPSMKMKPPIFHGKSAKKSCKIVCVCVCVSNTDHESTTFVPLKLSDPLLLQTSNSYSKLLLFQHLKTLGVFSHFFLAESSGGSPRGSDEIHRGQLWTSPLKNNPTHTSIKISILGKKNDPQPCAFFFCIMFVEEIGHLHSLIHPKHG